MIARLPAAALVSLALCALPLAGCGKKSGGSDQRTASGEVLPGSISDSMLPLESVTSEPPIAKIVPQSGKSGAPDASASGEADASQAGDASAAPVSDSIPVAKPSAKAPAKPSAKPAEHSTN